jgi:CheY-like chemotaxis protein
VRIRQVLLNLAANAVKFTERGFVLIEADCPQHDSPTARMRISVTDSGPGIAADKLEILFEEFKQADMSTTRKYGGTGLGLAISKKLVELMGGTIHVESEPGTGAKFWFTLPLPAMSAPDNAPWQSLAGTRILLVYASEMGRSALEEQLSGWGARTMSLASGEQALETYRAARAGSDPFEVVIADLQTPGVEQGRLVERMGAETAPGTTAFLLLTSPSGLGLASRQQACACLIKPVREARLLEALAEKMAPAGTPSPDRPPQRTAGRGQLRVLLAEDNIVNQRVAVHMLRALGIRADLAADGRSAVDIARRERYDLILMDCQMPLVSGYEAAREIRRSPGPSQNVRIIALTAEATLECREHCRQAGMDGYLAKPFTAEALAEALGLREEPPVPASCVA